MCIVPNPERFIFAETVLQDSKAKRKRECAHISTVGEVKTATSGRAAENAAAGAFLLPDFTDDVHVGPSEGVLRAGASTTAPGVHPLSWGPTYTPVTDAPWVQQQSSGPASARVVVKKVGKNKWTVEGTATGDNGPPDSASLLGEAKLETELTIPDSRSGISTVKMDVTVQTLSGVCDLRAGVGFVTGAGGSNSPTGMLSPSSPRILTYSLSESGASLKASLGFQIIAYPLQMTAGSCNAKGNIELILPEE
jgi:hypothetical protein